MTDAPTVYTAHDIPDLLNTLPTLFGFTPTESLVAVATSGARRRFGFRLRVDIPAEEHIDELASLVARHLRHQGAEGAILFAVTQRQELAAILLSAVERVLEEIELVVSVRADGSRYWTTEPSFPADGIRYETSDHHLAVVQAIAAGQQILPDRQALVDRFRPVSGPRRRWLEHAADAVLAQVVPIIGRATGAEVSQVGLAQVGPIIDTALAGETLTDDDVVRFSVWVSSVAVRDEVWARMTRDNASDMLQMLVHVSRSAVPPFEPAVLSLAAVAAWLTGDGAQALIAVERALAADPSYSMAQLMLDLLEAGVPPAAWNGCSTSSEEEQRAG